MTASDPPTVQSYRPEDLLGPLNPVERQNAPEWLYVSGARDLLKLGARVSIVGSRDASPQGLRRAAKLSRELVAAGVYVVSGLARGVDGAAHRAAMDAGGRTIAVLGTALDQVYPPEHADLQQRIIAEHVAVSQFENGTPTRKTNFPRRNRVMALISDATVIVEAGDGSGSLSQGWEALRLGRPLFVMKAVAEDSSLTWPGEMMRYGAQVLAATAQVLEVVPLDAGGALADLTF
jgi:DNA processing protein